MKVFLALLGLLTAISAWAEPLPAKGSVEVRFTPWDDAEGALLRVLGEARQTIYVQAFLLTSRTLGRALIDAHRRGVAVAVLADREMVANGDNSQIPKLVEAGIPVWLEVRYQSAHNKIVLIDPEEAHPIVVTGSYNFTFSAQARNAENLLILSDNPPLARAYLANWRRHRGEALAYAEGGLR
ncbi:phospholipase D family nuclease [Sulfurisoma sediminicola]|uniref:phospholipase D n=1 Tax=Sulfurisoma sediminicola TaxID=1381557 RepID=A0A497XJE2_9PROT|nr:phospholipase D family protein [Sulfurisoma sediminicola]RLJ67495.1 phospholipase D-like protein [Sulfurisoma sediminicola]